MKKAVLIPLGLILGLLTASTAFAKTTVEISNNGENSKSDVKINSSVKTNGSSDTSDNETRVRITTNGETKEYVTTGDEDINVQSSDGTSKVQINNNNSVNSDDSKDDKKEASNGAIDKKIKEKVKEIKDEVKKDDVNVSEFIKNQLSRITAILFFWRG